MLTQKKYEFVIRIRNDESMLSVVETTDHICYPDQDYQLKWLRTFLEFKAIQEGSNSTKVTDRYVEVLYVQVNKFALAGYFFWGIWALIQSCHSTIDIDYLEYSIVQFNEYFAKRDAFLSLKMPA
ncbi:Ethanolamine kinase 1 [Lamellibrachia satsuma]|nr:Ethanolamine kinase 1 [Lamellibrachia satsuma]